jgi:hypothetical protein
LLDFVVETFVVPLLKEPETAVSKPNGLELPRPPEAEEGV